MRAAAGLRLAFVLLLPLLVTSARAWPTPDPPVRYSMNETASFQAGCFDFCDCILFEKASVEGSFLLAELDPQDGWLCYAITDVAWIVGPYDGQQHRISGTGELRLDPQAGLQQLILDLSVDDLGAQRFDSQVVPTTVSWPAIDAMVSIHQLVCYDMVVEVRAEPAGAVPVADALEWGALKQSFEH